jgi:hypothetical protein
MERFVKVGDRLEALSSQFEDARVSLTGRQGMIPQLQKFEEYGCKSEKTLPQSLNVFDSEDEGLNGLLVETSPVSLRTLSDSGISSKKMEKK